MGDGDGALDRLVRNSVAPSTWTAYGKAWQGWLECVGDLPVASCAAARLQVTLSFLLCLRQSGASGVVAQHKISGVAFHFQLRGWESIGQAFVVRKVLRGWVKERVSRDSRKPVSFELLVSLLASLQPLCSSPYEVSLFSTAFGLAFFGAFRVGELVSPSKHTAGGLACDDVVLGPDSVRLKVSRSKTDQMGVGSWVHLRAVQGELCPVRLVSGYLRIRSPGSQFFVHQDGFPLTRFQFASVFKKCLMAVGENPAEYGTHSFRIGAATEAVRAGLPEGEVMRIGRWQSRSYVGYVRPELLA